MEHIIKVDTTSLNFNENDLHPNLVGSSQVYLLLFCVLVVVNHNYFIH